MVRCERIIITEVRYNMLKYTMTVKETDGALVHIIEQDSTPMSAPSAWLIREMKRELSNGRIVTLQGAQC